MQFPEALRSLNHRDYRLFWCGQLISLIGTWMQSLGQSWLILQLTDSPFLLGLISTLQFAPMLLFSLVAGAFVDRLPKRKLILATQSGLMCTAFALAALEWSGHIRYWHVAVLALLLGIFQTVDVPARQSYVVEMVGKSDLMNAIALNSAVFNGARILGPAAAGVLVAKYGVAMAFFMNGLSFLAVIAALTRIRAEGLPTARRNVPMVQEVREGLAYVRRTPLTLFLISLLATVSLFVINFQVLIPLLAKKVLGLEAQGFGFLMSATGLGALIGAIALAVLGGERPSLRTVIAAGAVLCTAALVITAFRVPLHAAVILAVIGCAQITFSASINTTLQVTTPDALRGRVMSLYALVFGGSTPIGAFFIGLITQRFGAPMGWVSAGALGLLSVIALTLWWQMRGRHTDSPAH